MKRSLLLYLFLLSFISASLPSWCADDVYFDEIQEALRQSLSNIEEIPNLTDLLLQYHEALDKEVILREVQLALDLGCDPNFLVFENGPLLIATITFDCLPMTFLLLQSKKINKDTLDRALKIAIENSNDDLVEALLKQGADCLENKYILKPLRNALELQALGVAKTLLEHGADPKTCPDLLYDIASKNDDIMGFLIDSDTDKKSISNTLQQILRIAIEKDDINLVSYLLNTGINPCLDLFYPDGRTRLPCALEIAVKTNNIECIKVMLDAIKNNNLLIEKNLQDIFSQCNGEISCLFLERIFTHLTLTCEDLLRALRREEINLDEVKILLNAGIKFNPEDIDDELLAHITINIVVSKLLADYDLDYNGMFLNEFGVEFKRIDDEELHSLATSNDSLTPPALKIPRNKDEQKVIETVEQDSTKSSPQEPRNLPKGMADYLHDFYCNLDEE